jgi:hypothetical protein
MRSTTNRAPRPPSPHAYTPPSAQHPSNIIFILILYLLISQSAKIVTFYFYFEQDKFIKNRKGRAPVFILCLLIFIYLFLTNIYNCFCGGAVHTDQRWWCRRTRESSAEQSRAKVDRPDAPTGGGVARA